MSKKLLILLIILFIQLGFFPHSALAVSSCKDIAIDWEPKIFLENAGDYTLRFTIKNENTFRTLKDRIVYLEGGESSSSNPDIIVQDTTFSLVLNGNQIKNAAHNRTLRWLLPEEGNKSEDFCSNVVYQVGAIDSCTILDKSVPAEIPPPPKNSLTVRVVGKANTNYELKINFAVVSHIRTDQNGQGQFPPVVIPGKNGELKHILVLREGRGAGGSCDKYTRINPLAPIPASPPSDLVIPENVSTPSKACDENDIEYGLCSSAGGEEKTECTDDENNPGISTAIGCIHTDPAELVKDVIKFAIGIGGGLAFLMMLLGTFGMITSAGNPDSLRAGQDRLTSAIIGLLFVIFATLLLQIIGVGILDIPGFK